MPLSSLSPSIAIADESIADIRDFRAFTRISIRSNQSQEFQGISLQAEYTTPVVTVVITGVLDYTASLTLDRGMLGIVVYEKCTGKH